MKVFTRIIVTILSQKAIQKLLLELASYLASKTKNKIDDKGVEQIKKLLGV